MLFENFNNNRLDFKLQIIYNTKTIFRLLFKLRSSCSKTIVKRVYINYEKR